MEDEKKLLLALVVPLSPLITHHPHPAIITNICEGDKEHLEEIACFILFVLFYSVPLAEIQFSGAGRTPVFQDSVDSTQDLGGIRLRRDGVPKDGRAGRQAPSGKRTDWIALPGKANIPGGEITIWGWRDSSAV